MIHIGVIPKGTAGLVYWIKATVRFLYPDKRDKTIDSRVKGVLSPEDGSTHRVLSDPCRPFQRIQYVGIQIIQYE